LVLSSNVKTSKNDYDHHKADYDLLVGFLHIMNNPFPPIKSYQIDYALK